MNTILPVIDLILQDVRDQRLDIPSEHPGVAKITFRNLETILLERIPMLEPEDAIATQLRRLNDNLEAGTLNIRTHHPLCATPKDADYSVQQLDVMGRYLNTAIAEGRLVLPAREGAQS